jgi:diphthine synthase
MFYIIGLGLCDEKDITVRGLEVGAQSAETYSIIDGANQAVKSCSRVYLEAYTSILMVEKSRLVCTVLDMHLRGLTVWKVGGVL